MTRHSSPPLAHLRERRARCDSRRPCGAGDLPEAVHQATGPAIDGVTPRGSGLVEQCNLPAEPGTLTVTVKRVNLPDGTVLTVN